MDKKNLTEKIFEYYYPQTSNGEKFKFDMPTISYFSGIRKGIEEAVTYMTKNENQT